SESGALWILPESVAPALPRSFKFFVTRLLIKTGFDVAKRHSIDDDTGGCVEATVLCSTTAPHASSSVMPLSKPADDAYTRASSVLTKLFRMMPPKCIAIVTPGQPLFAYVRGVSLLDPNARPKPIPRALLRKKFRSTIVPRLPAQKWIPCSESP